MFVKLTPAVNFINVIRARFSYEPHFGSFFYVKKAAETTFVRKTRASNVDEIDTWSAMPALSFVPDRSCTGWSTHSTSRQRHLGVALLVSFSVKIVSV